MPGAVVLPACGPGGCSKRVAQNLYVGILLQFHRLYFQTTFYSNNNLEFHPSGKIPF